jgi:4-amino-4-deoxy-L-arabinose transferase-like glycosyltransferase
MLDARNKDARTGGSAPRSSTKRDVVLIVLLFLLVGSYVLTEEVDRQPWLGLGTVASLVVPFLIVATYAIDYSRRPHRRVSPPRGFWTPSRRRRVSALGLFVVALIFRAFSVDMLFYALVAAAAALFVLDLVLLFVVDEDES